MCGLTLSESGHQLENDLLQRVVQPEETRREQSEEEAKRKLQVQEDFLPCVRFPPHSRSPSYRRRLHPTSVTSQNRTGSLPVRFHTHTHQAGARGAPQ